jgi:ATP-dependent DNA helicase RecQ
VLVVPHVPIDQPTDRPTVTEPVRPSRAEVETELADHVRSLAGPDAVPRPDQIAVVTDHVFDR